MCGRTSIGKAGYVADIRTVEARVALNYWQAFPSTIPECFDFQGRMTSSHQNNASDPVNLALNYAYGVVGLETSVGYLHKFSRYTYMQIQVRKDVDPLGL